MPNSITLHCPISVGEKLARAKLMWATLIF